MGERHNPWRQRTYVVRWHVAVNEPPVDRLLVEWGDRAGYDVRVRYACHRDGSEDDSRKLVRVQPVRMPGRHNGRVPREVLSALRERAAELLAEGEAPEVVLTAMGVR